MTELFSTLLDAFEEIAELHNSSDLLEKVKDIRKKHEELEGSKMTEASLSLSKLISNYYHVQEVGTPIDIKYFDGQEVQIGDTFYRESADKYYTIVASNDSGFIFVDNDKISKNSTNYHSFGISKGRTLPKDICLKDRKGISNISLLTESRLKEADEDYLKIGNMVYPGSVKTANMDQTEVQAAYNNEQEEKENARKEIELKAKTAKIRAKINSHLKDIKNPTYEDRLHAYFSELVPPEGPASTVAGEIVRAANRLVYRWFNDGDMFNIGYGIDTCAASASFLMNYTNDEIYNLIEEYLADHSDEYDSVESYMDRANNDYEVFIYDLMKAVVDDIDNNTKLLISDNKINSVSQKDVDIYDVEQYAPTFSYSFEIDSDVMEYYDNDKISENDIINEVDSWFGNYDHRDISVEYTEICLSGLSYDDYNAIHDVCVDSRGSWRYPWEDYIVSLRNEYGYPEDWKDDEEDDE